jgi:hypothetical protein
MRCDARARARSGLVATGSRAATAEGRRCAVHNSEQSTQVPSNFQLLRDRPTWLQVAAAAAPCSRKLLENAIYIYIYIYRLHTFPHHRGSVLKFLGDTAHLQEFDMSQEKDLSGCHPVGP